MSQTAPMILPENILRCMSPQDRAALGRGGMTAREATEKATLKAERELQGIISNWLRLRDWYFDVDSMARKRTGTKGAPDFQFPYRGLFVAWEVKVGRNDLDTDQRDVRDKIIAQGGEWRVIRGLREAQEHLREIDASIDVKPSIEGLKCG